MTTKKEKPNSWIGDPYFVQGLIDKLQRLLREQPILNKMLQAHHVDIHDSLEEIKEILRMLQPKSTSLTLWQHTFYQQVKDASPMVKNALKTTLALDSEPEEDLAKDYLFFLLWKAIDKVEFTEQGVKNFEEYRAQTEMLVEKSKASPQIQ